MALSKSLPRQRSQDTESERFARLRALPSFDDFHDVVLWELMRLGKWRRLDRGTVLMRENTPGDSFCVLIEGQVSVSRQGWHLSTLDPGVTLGEMTYLRPEHRIRTATAVAETEVLVLKIRNPALREASEEPCSRALTRLSFGCWWAGSLPPTSNWRNGKSWRPHGAPMGLDCY
jgi:hypothetical protein